MPCVSEKLSPATLPLPARPDWRLWDLDADSDWERRGRLNPPESVQVGPTGASRCRQTAYEPPGHGHRCRP